MKVIYIAGLSHSGTTLLDLLLSCHPRIVGIGEFYQMSASRLWKYSASDIGASHCSCGRQLKDCPVWSDYLSYLDEKPESDFTSSYKKMTEILRRHYGADVILLDSSKYVRPMRRLFDRHSEIGLSLSEIKVLHLIKDVRNYAFSQKKKLERSRKGSRGNSRGASWWPNFRRFRKWHGRNLRVERNLASGGVESFRLGYEELCFYPERMLRMVCGFVGVEFEASMLNPAEASGHIAIGNRMAFRPGKSRKIFYDHRWFTDNSILFQYGLHPVIRRYNEEKVYGNIKELLEAGTFEPY